jgi:hypothetical protein
MIFSKIYVQFRIRILQKVSDPCGSGSGSGSTTLLSSIPVHVVTSTHVVLQERFGVFLSREEEERRLEGEGGSSSMDQEPGGPTFSSDEEEEEEEDREEVMPLLQPQEVILVIERVLLQEGA